jgi:hypothetical protein
VSLPNRSPADGRGGCDGCRRSISEDFHKPFKTGGCLSGNLALELILLTEIEMPKFVIEREIPGAGKLSPAELKSISQKSCGVLSSMGPSVQWVHSYVTGDRIYCIYQATDESLIKRHAELGGFPANRISRITSMIDPTTAE